MRTLCVAVWTGEVALVEQMDNGANITWAAIIGEAVNEQLSGAREHWCLLLARKGMVYMDLDSRRSQAPQPHCRLTMPEVLSSMYLVASPTSLLLDTCKVF